MDDKYIIYIVSDSLGETAEYVARAAVAQFKNIPYEIVKFPYVRDLEQAEEIIEEAKTHKSIVFTTILGDLNKTFHDMCSANKIDHVDVMSNALNAMEQFLGEEPLFEPGIIRRLDERYFKKVEAIEFAVKYDDGKDPRGIKKADIVLVGVSRTSKTPIRLRSLRNSSLIAAFSDTRLSHRK